MQEVEKAWPLASELERAAAKLLLSGPEIEPKCMCMEMGEVRSAAKQALVRRHTRCGVRHGALFDWSSGSQVPAQLLVYAATGLLGKILPTDGYGYSSLYTTEISPQLIHMLIVAWD